MLASAHSAWAADPIELQVRPVWQSLAASSQRYPFLVRVKNNTSRDAVGRIILESEGGSTIVPVEVAKQSEKQVPIYPLLGAPALGLTFESNIFRGRLEVPYSQDYALFRIGLIGDASGDLAFLRMRYQGGAVTADSGTSVGYCRPEEAPDRTAGYFPLDAVFLGEGSERLNERQIEALKQYVVQGGRIVLPGGANVPLLSVPAWRSVLPVVDAAPRTLAAGTTLTMASNRGRVAFAEPVTVMLGKPEGACIAAASIGDEAVSVVRPIGMGGVVFLGYNPFEEPMLSHPNRRQLVLDAMKAAMYGTRGTRVLEAALSSSSDYRSFSYSPSSGSYVQYGESQERGPEGLYVHSSVYESSMGLGNSPFNVQLVPASTVGWIFLGFFLVVVPLNFLVLRLVRRMELAWVTSPILSIAFAALLISYSRGLYSAKLSRAYQGVAVQDLDSGLASQWIKATYFIPRGGTYDLSLPKTDQILASAAFSSDPYVHYGYSRMAQNAGEGYSILDAGSAELPEVDVPNLAFREVVYHRAGTAPIPVEVSVRRRNGRLEGEIANRSEWTLRRVALVVKDKTFILRDIPPGQSHPIGRSTSFTQSRHSLIASGRTSDQAVLYALVSEFDPGGPGAVEPKSTKVLLISSKKVEGAR